MQTQFWLTRSDQNSVLSILISLVFITAFFFFPNDVVELIPFKIDINQACPEELETIPGIGPSTAKKICLYRKNHGDYKKVEDLSKIFGMPMKDVEGYFTTTKSSY